nr:MAG TPA: hypothetical protein [Caudoviricetes sp.]
MAAFEEQLPTELMEQFELLDKNTETMLKEMTREGAKKVLANVKANVPQSFRKSGIMKCLKLTRSYKTPSDDGINTKVAFYGYFQNEDGKKTPAPLVCNLFEYGRSSPNPPYPKHPFMRRSFVSSEIESAMNKVQEKYLPKG